MFNASLQLCPSCGIYQALRFNVAIKLIGFGRSNIKAIRQLTSLGLKESKELAETAGSKILTQVGKEAADDAKAKLEAAGASVELA